MTQAQKLADLSQAYTAGALALRNRLINGNFKVRQRGTDFTVGTAGVVQGQVTADCWRLNSSTGARVVVNTGVPSHLSLLRESGAGSVEVFNRIETADWADMIGQSVTLSFELYRTASGTSAQTLSASVLTTDGEADFVNTAVVIPTKTFVNSANSVWEKFSATGVIPAGSTQKGIYIDLIANGVGALASAQYLIVRNVQFEVGLIATPFEFRHTALEFALCRRYFQKVTYDIQGYQAGGQTVVFGQMLPVAMRAGPTPTYVSSANLTNCNTPTSYAAGSDRFSMVTTVTALGTFAAVGVAWNLSAEL